MGKNALPIVMRCVESPCWVALPKGLSPDGTRAFKRPELRSTRWTERRVRRNLTHQRHREDTGYVLKRVRNRRLGIWVISV